MPKLVDVDLTFSIPGIGSIKGKWAPNDDEQKAAWELYIELVTRISVEELKPGEGLLGEALSSLYSLFGTTREILRKYDPSIARPKGGGNYSFGYLAVVMLNGTVRPILSIWHPVLQAYESIREVAISPLEHESDWLHGNELRDILNAGRKELIEYANLFAEVAEVPSIVEHKGS